MKILKVVSCLILLAVCFMTGCAGFDKPVTVGNFTILPKTPYPYDFHRDNQTDEWRAYASFFYVPDPGLYGRR